MGLMIINKSDDALIGTYRLNCTKFSNNFYSATEFNIDAILELPGDKVELGRACVHPDFRNGMTIALLWKGPVSYTHLTLPTILLVQISVVAVSLKKKKITYTIIM
eukprot:TRINITY_DN21848_c0_g1_i1.p2 TRINITY_DN21848_c0_g1~~TRINITY_DN21848_c0_g1_i1.p2  ORF type:complete len:106 (-),score=23.41 TRINITY_DN21848_c0_g1_i1:22-339(-)